MASKKSPLRPKRRARKAPRRGGATKSGLLKALGGDAFQDLMGDLLDDELKFANAKEPGRATRLPNRGDGSIDFLVEESVRTDWFEGPALFQFKRTPKSVVADIRGSKSIQEYLRRGYSYYLVTAVDIPDAQQRETRLRNQVPAFASRLHVVGAREFEKALQRHLRLLARHKVAQVPPAIASLSDWTEWANKPELAMKSEIFTWTPDAARLRAIEQLKASVGTGAVIRIEGQAGVGKSRLALEAMSDFKEQVRYLSSSDADVVILADWVNAHDLIGILVLDECSRTRHDDLKRRLKPGKLTVVTVGLADRFGTAPADGVISLSPLQQEAFDRLARSAQSPVVPESERIALGRRCGRFVKLFRLALEAVEKHGLGAIPTTSDDLVVLLGKLLASDSDERLRAIRALALPMSFDLRQRAALAKLVGVSEAVMDEAADALERRALLGPAVASRSYMTPSLLAEWLATDFWRQRPLEKLEALARSDDPTLLASCFRRLLDAKDVQALGSFTSEPMRLSQIIPAKGLAALAETLSSSHPAESHDFVRRLLPSLEPADRLEFREALRSVAWFESEFDRAVESLRESGAPASFITPLFGTVLGLTQAPASARLQVLHRWADGDDASQELALHCAIEAAGHEATRLVSSNTPPLETNWKPRTLAEERSYRESAVSVVVRLLRHERLGLVARREGLQLIDELARMGWLPVAGALARKLVDAGANRQSVRSVLQHFERFEHAGLSDVGRRELAELIAEMGPRTLVDRVEEVVSQLEPLEPDVRHQLAKEIASNPSPEVFEPLFAPGAIASFDLGEELGRLDSTRSLLPLLVGRARKGGNNRLICGYLRNLTGEPTAEDLVDSWLADSTLTRLVFDATRIIEPSKRGLARLASLLTASNEARQWAPELVMGGLLSKFEPDEMRNFLDNDFLKPEVVHSLYFQRDHLNPEPTLRDAWFKAWLAVPNSSLRGHTSWEWQESALKFDADDRPGFAKRIAEVLLDENDSGLVTNGMLRRLKLSTQKALVDELGRRAPSRGIRWAGVFSVDDPEFIEWALDWAKADSNRRAFLIELTPLGRMPAKGLANELLLRHPKDEGLRRQITSRLRTSGVVWGGDARLEESLVARAELLARDADPPLAKLAAGILRDLTRQHQVAKARVQYERETGETVWLGEAAPKWSR
jgi:hypothetical protein